MLRSRALVSMLLPLASVPVLLAVASPSLGGCTTITTVETRSDASASAAPTGNGEEETGETGETEEDGGTVADGGSSSKKDAGSKADASTPDSGPVLAGGSITVTCPSTGFHKGPPVTIASVPSAYLPRCSTATRACYFAATTSAAADACLAADTTAPATVAGEPVDCQTCERTQGSYCLAHACQTEFTAYACCAQAQGDAACGGLLGAVTSCAGAAGKPAFESCLNSLVPRCFK